MQQICDNVQQYRNKVARKKETISKQNLADNTFTLSAMIII